MTSSLHSSYKTIKEIEERKLVLNTELVLRKLEGQSKLKMPPYSGSTTKSLAEHYAKEIELTTDLGWGDPKAIRAMKHHALEAVKTAQSHARVWTLNTERGGPGGWNNLPKHASDLIKGLRSRIEPALRVADAEIDSNRILRSKYNKIEADHLQRITTIKFKNATVRKGSSTYVRKKIRSLERMELQAVLDSMFLAISAWENDLKETSKQAGRL